MVKQLLLKVFILHWFHLQGNNSTLVRDFLLNAMPTHILRKMFMLSNLFELASHYLHNENILHMINLFFFCAKHF